MCCVFDVHIDATDCINIAKNYIDLLTLLSVDECLRLEKLFFLN